MSTQDNSMTKDEIKACALKNYKEYVEGELGRLNDGINDDCGLDISEFEPEPRIKDNFKEAELKELQWHFKNLKNTKNLLQFCVDYEIDLSKYSKIKGLCRN